jgi:hypothetical protein
MRTLFGLAALAVAIVGAASPAPAQRIDSPAQQFGEGTPLQLDPAQAYIYFRSYDRASYVFLREVTEAEQADHDQRRATALAEARERYPRELRRWEFAEGECRDNRFAMCGNRRPRPVEPTEANFAFAPPELDNFVGNGFRPRLVNDGGWSGWLIAVEPGTYSLYGTGGIVGGRLQDGWCYCMGSVRFAARAGEITDIGEVQAVPESGRARLTPEDFALGHLEQLAVPGDSLPVPPQFAQLPVVRAELRAADRMPNYFGMHITRLAPIPGVLDYRRDVVIDVRSGAAVTASAAASGR